MARYEPPPWGAQGRNVFGIYLEVIKSGVVLETLPLPITADSSCVVAGRMDTVCDLVLAHPSISRVHAALQFDKQGALFLCDLRSTHGCCVNKKRVKAEEFERLHIGDVLCFGESTRLYAVCGPAELLPAEYESLNLAKFREKLEKKRGMVEKKKQEEDRGASWGFGEDAEEESDEEEEEDKGNDKEQLPDYLRDLKEEEEAYKSSVSKADVSEKDQRLYQQLQTRIRKMENLKLERSRILAKQHQLDGLSEGQQRTLDRNEQRIEALMKEIEELETRIHAKNDQRSKTGTGSGAAVRKKRNVNDELYDYSSDEDDFYDRTKANQQKFAARKQQLTGVAAAPGTGEQGKSAATKKEVLTAESIQANVSRLETELAKMETELVAASAKTAEASEESKQEEDLDSLDSFMAATTSQLHVNTVETIAKRKLEVETELKRQKQLLAVAMPALATVPIQAPTSKKHEAVEKPVTKSSASRTDREVSTDASQATAEDKEPKKPQVPVTSKPTEAKPTVDKPVPAASKSLKSPEPKRPEPVLKKRRISGPVGPRPAVRGEQQTKDSDVLEGGDKVWVPPANQSGDGRTRLNDKYGY